MQTNATRRMQCIIQIKLAVHCNCREFDGRPISLGYRPPYIGLWAHTVKLSSAYDDRVLRLFALHIVKQYCGMRNAECEIRTTYNLRNIPHQNFRKIYVADEAATVPSTQSRFGIGN